MRVYYQAGNEEEKFTDTTITVPPVTQSYQLNNLKGDTPYTIRVSAGNSVGFGPAKEWSFKTLRPGYPATPSSVRAQEVQATTVKLVWEVAEVGKPYTYYYISALVNGSVSKGQSFTVKSEDVRRSGLEETAMVGDYEVALALYNIHTSHIDIHIDMNKQSRFSFEISRFFGIVYFFPYKWITH